MSTVPSHRVRAFLDTLLVRKGDRRGFTDADTLVLDGRLDSLDLLEVIGFLEGDFGLDFATIEFDQAKLGSVNAIVALIGAGT